LLSKLNVGNTKTKNKPLGTHLKFSKRKFSQTDEEESHKSKVSYAFIVGSLMYVMVCTILDIAHAVRALGWCQVNIEIFEGHFKDAFVF